MKIDLIQTNFTTGELSPEAYGRVDIAKYQNAAKTIKNCIVRVLGGAKGRGGLRFVAGTKINGKRSRLIPYIFNRGQAYIIELGDGYARFYNNQGAQIESGGLPYEVASPYTEAMLFAMDYVQGADTMFTAHQEVPLNRIQRFADTDWRITAAPLVNQPFQEIGFRPTTNLTLSTAAVATDATATASAATFLAADAGRRIVANGGVATIRSVTSSTVAVVDITSAFQGTSVSAPDWVIDGSPQAPITPSATGPIDQRISLSLGQAGAVGGSQAITKITGGALGIYYFTVAGHGFATGNSVVIAGCAPAFLNGTWSVGKVSDDVFMISYGSNLGAAVTYGTAARAGTSGIGGWRESDVGSIVKVNGGLVKIESIDSAIVALGRVLAELSSAIQANTDAWSLEPPVWNSYDGYPRTVTLNSQRLVAAGTPSFPLTIWGSEIGNRLNFLLGTDDDNAFSYELDSREVNPIAYLPSNKSLMALTYGGEFTIAGGQEKPITPTNIQAESQSTFGCALVRPILIGNQLFFVQRDGKVLRAASYTIESNAYIAADVSKLSQHLMEPGIVDIAYQQFPYSCIWMVREDGKLNSVTIDNEENVIAWTWHETDGEFESVACIPGEDKTDQVWVVVKRVVDDVTVRYVERIDDTVHTDSCSTGEAETATDTWGGFDHLVGKTLKVLADGVPISDVVVNEDGEIVLERPASRIEAGLQYVPTVQMLTPEAPGPTGTSQGKQVRVNNAKAYVLDTVGVKVNGDEVELRRLDGEILDQPVSPFTGVLDLMTLGWEKTNNITFEQPLPLPFHLLAVIREFSVNS
jgi:hypothetical protein